MIRGLFFMHYLRCFCLPCLP